MYSEKFLINKKVLIKLIRRQQFRKVRIWQINSQAPELYKGPRARCARSGENGEGEVKSL